MVSRKQIVSMMAGVAMLALPGSALAGHHHRDGYNARPFAWHDNGLHRGWMKGQAGFYGGPGQRPPFGPAYAWNGGYHRECDDDGDRCEFEPNAPAIVPPPFARSNYEDEDEDEDEGQGYNYNSYPQGPYSSFLQGPVGGSPSQQLNLLVARRRITMAQIAQLRARHDSRGAARLVPVVKNLNQRITRLQNQISYNGGYMPPAYVPPANYVQPFSYNTGGYNNLAGFNNPAGYNNFAGYNNNFAGYNGAGAYGPVSTGNPTVDALVTLVPLFGVIR